MNNEHKEIKRLSEGMKLLGENLEVKFISRTPDLLLHAEVTNDNRTHNVYYHNDLWRCTCEDYQYRGVNRDEGSFLCKHIYAVIKMLRRRISMSVCKERTIQFLLDKYTTKQPGEVWDIKMEKENGKSVWNMKQKIRLAQVFMSRLNIQGTNKDRIIYIIKDVEDFKILCKNCSNETIIAAICFYVMKTINTGIRIEDYKVFNENNLTEKVYLTIITKLCDYYQKK